jgi:hypothetical protein
MKEYNPILGALFSGKGGEGGYNAGFRQSRLAALYQGDDPEKQALAAKQLAAVDPESAGKWQQEQAKVAQQNLERKARMLASAPSLEAKQQLYASIRPEVSKLWAEAPEQYTPELDQMLTAWAGGSQESADPAAVREVDLIAKRMGLTPGAPDYLNFVKTQYGLAPKAAGWKYGETASGAPWRADGDVYEVLDRESGQWMPYGKQAEVPAQPPHDGEIKNDDGSTWAKFSDMPVAEQEAYKAAQAAMLGGSDAGYEVRGGKVAQIQQPTVRPRQDPFSKPQEQQTPPSGYRWKPDGTLEPIPGGGADPKSKAVSLSEVNTLRDDYTKAISQPMAMMDAYEKMRQAYKNPSPAGDIALVYAYMKILDPTSVVREAEFETAVKAGSVPDTISNMFYKAKSGQLLTQNRQDFLMQGAKLYAGAKQKYNQVKQNYKQIAERNGVNIDDVLVDGHIPISQKFPAQGQVYKPQTDADFAKIPKGSIYIDPDDGKQYRK